MPNTETTGSRKQGGSNFIPLAVALVAVAIFLGWLATRDPMEPVAVDEPDAPTDVVDADDPGEPVVVSGDDLAGAGADRYVGQYVQLSGAEVLSPLGARMVWIDAGGAPYLVLLEEGNTSAGLGSQVTVRGHVRQKTDAVLDEWQETGVLETSDHRLQAEYGTTYIEARRVQPGG
jgi:hypothetical protein